MFCFKAMVVSVGFSLAAIPGAQASEIVSAADLNATCASEASGPACSSYIAGFARGFYYGSIATQAGHPPCVAGNLNHGDARAVVINYLGAHPEMLEQGAAAVMAQALVTAFPCGPRK